MSQGTRVLGRPLPEPLLWGLVAEFGDAEPLIAAAAAARAAGYRAVDAYTPLPVEGLTEALGLRPTRLPVLVLIGGLLGGACGYTLAWWTSVCDYPLDVGGRPLHSWPSFVPVTFETTILGAALTAVLGMLALNRLPMPYHPLFNVSRFALASRNRFFLSIESTDPLFEHEATRRFLLGLRAEAVHDVER